MGRRLPILRPRIGAAGWQASCRTSARRRGRAQAAPGAGPTEAMASGSRLGVVVAAMAFGVACANGSGRGLPDRPMLGIGQYQVESIRSRATLEGVERMVEITESGTRLLDS